MGWDDKLKWKAEGPRSYCAITTLLGAAQWDSVLNVGFSIKIVRFSI